MANYAETALLSSLTDVDALEALAKARLAEECVPTPGLFEIFSWAIDYFMASGRRQAPSRVALEAAWGSRLAEIGAELEAEDVQVDTVTSAVEHLRSQHALHQFQLILTDGAEAMGSATEPERAAVAAATADRMVALVDAVRDRPSAIDGASGLAESLAQLKYRIEHPGQRDSFGLGLALVDDHTGGIHEGELGIVISPKKTGKSWLSLWAMWRYFLAGGSCALFTLENSIKATFDRLACLACAVEYEAYQRGRISKADLERLMDWHADNEKDLAERITVLSPLGEARTAAAMCRAARLRGADAIVIDQLSHMATGSPIRYTSDREQLATRLQELSEAIKADTHPLKTLLLVQASRKAEEEAAKTGTLGSAAAFGTSEVEKVADQMYGLLQSHDDKVTGAAKLELLEFRRGKPEEWQLRWGPWKGLVSTTGKL